MKYLLLVLAFVVAYWLFKAYKRKSRNRGPAPPSPGAAGEDMVRCAHCGLHMPRSESLSSGESYYCTLEHRRVHQKTE